MHDYITILLSSMGIKEPYISMVGSFSGNNGVHSINSKIIVFINWSRIFMGKPKLPKNIIHKPSSLGRSYSINKICFLGTQHIY